MLETKERQMDLEGINIPNLPYSLMDYVHGRCHIFAMALHEELGYSMEFLWDDDFWLNEYDEEPTLVLVHAYCKLNDRKYIDGRGELTEAILNDEYEYNSALYEKTSAEELKELIEDNVLEEPLKGEINALRDFIRDNKCFYM